MRCFRPFRHIFLIGFILGCAYLAKGAQSCTCAECPNKSIKVAENIHPNTEQAHG